MKKLLFLILSITYCFGQEQGINLYKISFDDTRMYELSEYTVHLINSTPYLENVQTSQHSHSIIAENLFNDPDSVLIIQISNPFIPVIHTISSGERRKDWDVYAQDVNYKTTSDSLLHKTYKTYSAEKFGINAKPYSLILQKSSTENLLFEFEPTATSLLGATGAIWLIKQKDYNYLINSFKNKIKYTPATELIVENKARKQICLPPYTKISCNTLSIQITGNNKHKCHITLTCQVDSIGEVVVPYFEKDTNFISYAKLLTPSQYDSIQQSNQQKMIAETPKAEAQSKDSEEEEPIQPNEFGVTGPYKTMEEWDVAKNKYTPPMGHPYGVLFCGYSYLWTSPMIQMYMYDYMENSYSCNFEDPNEFFVKKSADKRYVVYSQTYSQRGVFMNNEHQNKITFEFYTKVIHGDPIIHHVRITGDIMPVAAFYANYWTHLKPGAMNPNAPYVFWGDKVSPLSINSATKTTFTINRSSNKLTEHAINIF